MRYLAGTILLLVLFPLLMAFDLVLICTVLGIFMMFLIDGPTTYVIGYRLAQRVFD